MRFFGLWTACLHLNLYNASILVRDGSLSARIAGKTAPERPSSSAVNAKPLPRSKTTRVMTRPASYYTWKMTTTIQSTFSCLHSPLQTKYLTPSGYCSRAEAAKTAYAKTNCHAGSTTSRYLRHMATRSCVTCWYMGEMDEVDEMEGYLDCTEICSGKLG